MRSGFHESIILAIKMPSGGSCDGISMILGVKRKVGVRTSNGPSLSNWTGWLKVAPEK